MRRWSTIWLQIAGMIERFIISMTVLVAHRAPSFGHFRVSHPSPLSVIPRWIHAVIIMPSEMPYMVVALLIVTHNSIYPCASRSPDLYKLPKPQFQPPHLLTHPLLSPLLKTEKTLLFCRP